MLLILTDVMKYALQCLQIYLISTDEYQKELTGAVKNCTKVITEECSLKNNILNSKAPDMRMILKIHKKNVPMIPLINFKCAPKAMYRE